MDFDPRAVCIIIPAKQKFWNASRYPVLPKRDFAETAKIEGLILVFSFRSIWYLADILYYSSCLRDTPIWHWVSCFVAQTFPV